MPIAYHLGVGRSQFLEGSQRLLCAPFLDDPQNGVQDHNRHDETWKAYAQFLEWVLLERLGPPGTEEQAIRH